MQEQPHPVVLVEGHLDEVVARAERAQLQPPVRRVRRRVEAGRLGLAGQLLELGDPRCARGVDRAGWPRRPTAGSRARSPPAAARRSAGAVGGVNCVRTAIMPQPMSTPTAAGMIAPSVGMTEPTVAPLPEVGVRHQRQVRVDERHRRAVTACSRVLSSRIDAQLMSFWVICCIVLSLCEAGRSPATSDAIGSEMRCAAGFGCAVAQRTRSFGRMRTAYGASAVQLVVAADVRRGDVVAVAQLPDLQPGIDRIDHPVGRDARVTVGRQLVADVSTAGAAGEHLDDQERHATLHPVVDDGERPPPRRTSVFWMWSVRQVDVEWGRSRPCKPAGTTSSSSLNSRPTTRWCATPGDGVTTMAPSRELVAQPVIGVLGQRLEVGAGEPARSTRLPSCSPWCPTSLDPRTGRACPDCLVAVGRHPQARTAGR